MNEQPAGASPVERVVVRLTPAQQKALAFARTDGELQIGGMDGRPVRRDVAERLVDMGLLLRSHCPLPREWWWGYRPVY